LSDFGVKIETSVHPFFFAIESKRRLPRYCLFKGCFDDPVALGFYSVSVLLFAFVHIVSVLPSESESLGIQQEEADEGNVGQSRRGVRPEAEREG
jgi:hypothetical protein